MQPAVIRNSAKTETGLGTQIFWLKKEKIQGDFWKELVWMSLWASPWSV